MKKCGIFTLILSIFFASQLHAQEETLTEEQQAYIEWAQSLWDSMQQQNGKIQLAGDIASLDVPDTFYYLSQEDSKKVLTDIWGNPPDSAHGVLGMLFPTGTTPFNSNSWGVTIEYSQEGYVSDEDADEINYNELLQQMKQDTAESSKLRVEQGYEPIALVGWAAEPFYDKEENKLHWAKEIKFGESESNTLNYNIRILGRKGVLVLNFIAAVDQLDSINNQLDSVLAIAEFNEGSRYADFDSDIDEVAAYGLGALIAGKVVAKTGILAAAFLFLKKFGVFIVIAIGAFFKKIFFGRKAKEQTTDS